MGYFNDLVINILETTVAPELQDGIGLDLIYNDNIADLTQFSDTNRIIKFTNLNAVEAVGITADSVNFKVEYHQIKKWFNAGGSYLYISINDVPAITYDYAELDVAYNFAQGEINIVMIHTPALVLAETEIAKLNVKAEFYNTEQQPLVIIYGADTSTTTLAAQIDRRSFADTYEYVGFVTGQDTENDASDLSLTTSLPEVGYIAGTLSSAAISENIGHVGKFNYVIGAEMVSPGLCINDGLVDNVIVPMTEVDSADIALLQLKGHIFFGFQPNKNGSYLSNDYNGSTGAYDSIHIVRVRNKIIRLISSVVIDNVKARVKFNADGTLRPNSLTKYYDSVDLAMRVLVDAGDVSGYETVIDPSQDVKTTGQLVIAVNWDEVFTTDKIVVNLNKN